MQRQFQNENSENSVSFLTFAEQVLNRTASSVGTANVTRNQIIEEEVKFED